MEEGSIMKDKKPMFENEQFITAVLQCLSEDMQRRKTVRTFHGNMNPKDGYTLHELRIIHESSAYIMVYMSQRAKEEKDVLRGMDIASFRYVDGKIYSDDEYEKLCQADQK